MSLKPKDSWDDKKIELWVQKKFDPIPEVSFSEFQSIYNPLSKERLIQILFNDYLESKIQRYQNVQNLVHIFKLKEGQIAAKAARARGGKNKASKTASLKEQIRERWFKYQRGQLRYSNNSDFARKESINCGQILTESAILKNIARWRSEPFE